MALGLNGPGFIEMGGGYSSVSDGFHNWADEYLRGVLSGGKNSFNGELTRQSRYGDTGWYYALGWNRSWSENWYSELDLRSSPERGFFLPKARTDAFLNPKLPAAQQTGRTVGRGSDL